MRFHSLRLFVVLALLEVPAYAADPLVLDVWPEGRVAGEPSGIGEEKEEPPQPGQREVKRIGNVTRPTVTVFPAPKETNTGAAVLIAPGGGYSILAWDLE